MKDIHEIMLEMDNLSNQIATTLNEEDIIKEEEAVRETCEVMLDPAPAFTVPFCCTISVPPNFTPTKEQRRIKVVGCIPFIVNVGVKTSDKCFFTSDLNFSDALCCGCCVCVNQEVCSITSDWIAFNKAASLRFNCDTVKVDAINVEDILNGSSLCGLKVTGVFKFFLNTNCCSF